MAGLYWTELIQSTEWEYRNSDRKRFGGAAGAGDARVRPGNHLESSGCGKLGGGPGRGPGARGASRALDSELAIGAGRGLVRYGRYGSGWEARCHYCAWMRARAQVVGVCTTDTEATTAERRLERWRSGGGCRGGWDAEMGGRCGELACEQRMEVGRREVMAGSEGGVGSWG